jgi:hypothetical protein
MSGFSEGRGSVKEVLSSSFVVISDDSVAVVVSPPSSDAEVPAQFQGDNVDRCVDVTIGPGAYTIQEGIPLHNPFFEDE